MADVTIDMSQGKSWAESGVSSDVTFSNGVSSIVVSIADWACAGAVYELETPIEASEISGITGSIKCGATTEYAELVVFLRDANGNRWWSGTSLSPAGMSDWTAINEVPKTTFWDDQADDTYPSQSITALGISFGSGSTFTNYAIDVKDLVIKEGATSLNTIKSEAKAVKRMVNGQLVIERNGQYFNAIGVAL